MINDTWTSVCKQISANSFKIRLPTDYIYMYNRLTECKQMSDFKLNCYYYRAILETI